VVLLVGTGVVWGVHPRTGRMLLESGFHKLDLFIEGVTDDTTSLASPEKPTVLRPVLRRAWMAELPVGSRSLLLRDLCSLSNWKRHSVSSFCASRTVQISRVQVQ